MPVEVYPDFDDDSVRLPLQVHVPCVVIVGTSMLIMTACRSADGSSTCAVQPWLRTGQGTLPTAVVQAVAQTPLLAGSTLPHFLHTLFTRLVVRKPPFFRTVSAVVCEQHECGGVRLVGVPMPHADCLYRGTNRNGGPVSLPRRGPVVTSQRTGPTQHCIPCGAISGIKRVCQRSLRHPGDAARQQPRCNTGAAAHAQLRHERPDSDAITCVHHPSRVPHSPSALTSWSTVRIDPQRVYPTPPASVCCAPLPLLCRHPSCHSLLSSTGL